MSERAPTGMAAAGSQLQVQRYVNEAPNRLNEAILSAIQEPSAPDLRIEWVSPLASKSFEEYRDHQFLEALGIDKQCDGLVGGFWPKRGPCWDALARMTNGAGKPTILLIEAKSHRLEVCGACRAAGESLNQIRDAFVQTGKSLGVAKQVVQRWEGPLYQSANRLAHLYYFREIAKIPAWLVNIYFVNDPYRPTSRTQWDDFLPEVWWGLRIDPESVPGLAHVFLDSFQR